MRGLAEITQCREVHSAFPIQNGCCTLGNRAEPRLIWHQHQFGSICRSQLQPNQRRVAMPFMHMLPDPGMNYTFNRPLLDGTSPARLEEVGAIAPRIKDYDPWHPAWLELAQRAEAEKRWLDAASYNHGAEFY